MAERSVTTAVTREIRRVIWPVLRELGFSEFASRTAWHETGEVVVVVNFQTVQSQFHTPLLLGNFGGKPAQATMSSFVINVGVSFRKLAHQLGFIEAQLFPWTRVAAYEGDLRLSLTKGIPQNPAYPPEIWGVKEDGSNIAVLIEDAREQIRKQAFPWIEHSRNLEVGFEHFRLLTHSERDYLFADRYVVTYDHDLFTAIAVRLGQAELALEMWERIRNLPHDERNLPHDERNLPHDERNGPKSSRRPGNAIPVRFWKDIANDRVQSLKNLGR